MPEGHTIHRRARDHARWFAGQAVAVSSPQGRFADGAARLDGRIFDGAEAWGKHLLYRFDPDEPVWVHIHLGLFGKFRMRKNPAPEPRGAVRLRVVGDERTLDLSGPTCCELLDADGRAALFERLGPDPLRADADPERFVTALSRRRIPIGAALLDQKLIAGIGNVYRAEILFILGIDPELPARDLGDERARELWRLTGELLRVGVRTDRIITVEPERTPHRRKRGDRLWVYKRRSCRSCEGPVRSWTLGGRTMHACASCQS